MARRKEAKLVRGGSAGWYNRRDHSGIVLVIAGILEETKRGLKWESKMALLMEKQRVHLMEHSMGVEGMDEGTSVGISMAASWKDSGSNCTLVGILLELY